MPLELMLRVKFVPLLCECCQPTATGSSRHIVAMLEYVFEWHVFRWLSDMVVAARRSGIIACQPLLDLRPTNIVGVSIFQIKALWTSAPEEMCANGKFVCRYRGMFHLLVSLMCNIFSLLGCIIALAVDIWTLVSSVWSYEFCRLCIPHHPTR